MQAYILRGAQVYDGQGFAEKEVYTTKGVFTDSPCEGAQVIDCAGRRLIPGLLDIHTHGANGVDANDVTEEKIEQILSFTASQGVSGQLLSVLTDTPEQTLRCIRTIVRAMKRCPQLMGIHLEGPFLASDYKGAMPEHLLREGDPALLREYQKAAEGNIRYLTVSPEVKGTESVIEAAKELGIVVAIGHSGADYDTAMRAIDLGAASITHTFNAMKLLHQHFPAILGAALESDAYCEMICDGRHLHPGIVRLLLKCKGVSRCIAVTDSIMAAGLPDGNYKLGVNDVTVKEGDALLTSTGVRAGSTLTSLTALRNLMRFTGRSMAELLPVLTENPAALLRLNKGAIAPGKDADCVLLSAADEADMTFSRGRLVCQRI